MRSIRAIVKGRWPLFATLVVIFGIFAGALRFGFVNWDDGIFIYENTLVTSVGTASVWDYLATSAVGYPVPLTVGVFYLLWTIGGGSAALFHAFNLFIHVVNVSIAARAIRQCCSEFAVRFGLLLAVGVHPVLVEPVVWATGLKDLLLAALVLLLLLRVEAHVQRAESIRPHMKECVGWVTLGIAAMAAKPTGVTIGPMVLAFAMWTPTAKSGGRSGNCPIVVNSNCDAPASNKRNANGGGLTRIWWAGGVLTLLGIVWMLWTVAQETKDLRTRAVVDPSVGRVFGALGEAVQHVLMPASLSPIYPWESVGVAELAVGVVAFLGAAVSLLVSSPARPWVCSALLAWAPVSNLIPLERFTADSYVYLPWFLMVIGLSRSKLLAHCLEVLDARAIFRLLWLIPVAWGFIAFTQVRVWKDDVSLWRAAQEIYPDNSTLIFRFGDALGRSGQLDEEIALYLLHLDTLKSAEKIPVALPVFYEKSGQIAEAKYWFETALSKDSAQNEMFYRYYVEFIAKYPEYRSVQFSDALRYGLQNYGRLRENDDLSDQEIRRLQTLGRTLGVQVNL